MINRHHYNLMKTTLLVTYSIGPIMPRIKYKLSHIIHIVILYRAIHFFYNPLTYTSLIHTLSHHPPLITAIHSIYTHVSSLQHPH